MTLEAFQELVSRYGELEKDVGMYLGRPFTLTPGDTFSELQKRRDLARQAVIVAFATKE